MSDIILWLQSLGLEKYSEVLASHDVDLAVAPDLTDDDLEKMGLSLGHRRKFTAAAAKLKAAGAPTAVAATKVQPVGQAAPLVERRQMTVVFIDLVGSTGLGRELDPEDLINLLREYRDACVTVIGKYDGFIAQYLGDGIMVYFGFPVAQEHAAERAVRAGLEIVEKVARLKQPDGQPLQCRVGIATGLVVAGEVSGGSKAGEETVVGDTPNLAARLQSAAEPGCVLVGPATHQLTRDFFEYSFLGELAIKGFRDPISIWKALRERRDQFNQLFTAFCLNIPSDLLVSGVSGRPLAPEIGEYFFPVGTEFIGVAYFVVRKARPSRIVRICRRNRGFLRERF